MAKNATDETAPTMIIPRGTDIQVDEHGQLSVRAPGNLVIQNSGNYGNLESVGGSIRVEPGVEVEAVSVRCADTCYVQGNLTAWRVTAQCLHLEDTAKAHIVLQDTERLEIGKGARLVGNFGSEKELFFLFSRFSQQVRSLPFAQQSASLAQPRDVVPLPRLEVGEETSPANGNSEEERAVGSLSFLSASDPTASQELPDPLFFSLLLLERDAAEREYPAESRRILDQIVNLLRERDVETLQHTYRTLFGRVQDPGKELRRAEELIGAYFTETS
jgi:hypothetical protein